MGRGAYVLVFFGREYVDTDKMDLEREGGGVGVGGKRREGGGKVKGWGEDGERSEKNHTTISSAHLSMSMLARLGGRHLHNLTRTTLHHHMPSFTQTGALGGVSLRGTCSDSRKILVRHFFLRYHDFLR